MWAAVEIADSIERPTETETTEYLQNWCYLEITIISYQYSPLKSNLALILLFNVHVHILTE